MTGRDERAEMLEELTKAVSPRLRELGFRGSVPHLYREGDSSVDLITFQFDKYGGAFIVEMASAPREQLRGPGGDQVEPQDARSYHAPERARLSATAARERWFRYRRGLIRRGGVEAAAAEVVALLPEAERYWAGERDLPHVRSLQ